MTAPDTSRHLADALTGQLGAAHLWTVGLCALFVLVTLAITVRARRTTHGAVDFYAGGREFSGTQNGLALTGDYLSAASFLGIAGMIALQGYDGFLYSIGFLVAWLLVLFSPVMSGKTDPVTGENLSVLPASVDIQFVPLENPALVAVPLGFLFAIVGSLLSRERNSGRYTELRVRSLTGWAADREAP